MKRMIFHLPMKINTKIHSGSQIRPMKMINAFKNIGYDVELIMGSIKERKNQIKQLKEKINDGNKYDFLYSESSTMPTALTENHHLPTAPFLDSSFFNYCRKKNIKTALFYRDIYWQFDIYKNSISYFKRKISIFFYKNDLINYNKYIDILYLPSVKMHNYFPIRFNGIVKALPPAVEEKKTNYKTINNIKFIYVGGIGGIYDLSLFSEVACSNKNNILNLCVRKNEWKKSSDIYKYENIIVHHKSPEELAEIYNKSDIAIYFIKPNELWNFAMGLKLFEYIAYKKPIIAVKGTAVGEFVETNNIGWVIEYKKQVLEELISKIKNNPSFIQEKIKNIEKIIPYNTWNARAKQVVNDLSK